MSDDFEDQLLTGDGKWWEFLDPQTYEVRDDLPRATQSSSNQLDWTKRARSGLPVGFSYFNHCIACGQGVPPDFSFCVHCGGEPRGSANVRNYTIVISEVEGEFAREAAVELMTAARSALSNSEVEALFADPPVIFNVTGRREQIAALTAKMAEVGIAARGFNIDDPSIPWLREAGESLVRHTPKLLLALALIAGGAIVAWFWSFLALIGAVVAVGGLMAHELQWYRNRYHLNLDAMLLNLTGFDPGTAAVARETLRLMSDREARKSVTVCLMEYYTLTQQFRAHSVVYSEVLRRSQEALEELMADVLALAHRYSKVDEFLRANPVAAVEQRVGELRKRTADDDVARLMGDAELEALEGQLLSMRKMEATRNAFRERLAALARSMEVMRLRFASVRATPSDEAFRSLEFEEALAELEMEFEVFEETLQVLQ